MPATNSIPYILWIGAAAIGAVALLQLLYYFILLIPKRGSRPLKQPKTPVMPTHPAGADARPAGPPPLISGGKLVVLSGLPASSEIPLPANSFVIGRYYHPENNIHIALDEKSVSRRHAQFNGDDDRREYYLTDTNSSYGTSLRVGDRVTPLTPGQRFRIYNGDVIQIGQAVTVRWVLPGDQRPAQTPDTAAQITRA